MLALCHRWAIVPQYMSQVPTVLSIFRVSAPTTQRDCPSITVHVRNRSCEITCRCMRSSKKDGRMWRWPPRKNLAAAAAPPPRSASGCVSLSASARNTPENISPGCPGYVNVFCNSPHSFFLHVAPTIRLHLPSSQQRAGLACVKNCSPPSASCNRQIIPKTDPNNSPVYSESVYLYGNYCHHPFRC